MTATNTHASVWDFFDRIYCISLESRKDRQASARKEFASVGLHHKVEFVLVEPHPSNPEQGIYESHMMCLRKGLEAGADTILVFEDDVVFDRFDENAFRQSLEFLNAHPEWKVLLLGALLYSSRKTSNPHVQRVRYKSLAHAYALHRPYAQTIAYAPWRGIVADVIFRPLKHDIYAVYPMFAFQGDFSSDNATKYKPLERFRRLCGGLKTIQKANEFYTRHKFGIIASHVGLVMVILCLLKAFCPAW